MHGADTVTAVPGFKTVVAMKFQSLSHSYTSTVFMEGVNPWNPVAILSRMKFYSVYGIYIESVACVIVTDAMCSYNCPCSLNSHR